MSEPIRTTDDEIDLIELIKMLWGGKWLITGLCMIGLIIAGGFLYITEPVYISKINIKENLTPALDTSEKQYERFRLLFHSEEVFQSWQETGQGTSVSFDRLSLTEEKNGFIFQKEEDDLLVAFLYNEDMSNILVRTNDREIILNIFGYTNYVNNLLTEQYVETSQIVLDQINQTPTQYEYSQQIFDIKKNMILSGTGEKIFIIDLPTYPLKESPKSGLILALSIILSGFSGVVLVLIRSAIRNYNRRAEIK